MDLVRLRQPKKFRVTALQHAIAADPIEILPMPTQAAEEKLAVRRDH